MLIETIASLVVTLSVINPTTPTPQAAVLEQVRLEQTIYDQSGMVYLGNWNITEYCEKCNSCGKHTTASGRYAEEWLSCAVSKTNYRELEGKTLYIEDWGYFRVDDWGKVRGVKNKNEWVDLYLPDFWHNTVWGKANVYLVEEE